MKVYVTDEKELIMEPWIKWAGNPNVTVAVKAFGLKATVQVVGFFYFGRKLFCCYLLRISFFLFFVIWTLDNCRWWICKFLLHHV